MVLDLQQAELQDTLDPKLPRDSEGVPQLIRELNDNAVDIAKAKQIEELWFMQYVESASGKPTEDSEAALSKTKDDIQKVLAWSKTVSR